MARTTAKSSTKKTRSKTRRGRKKSASPVKVPVGRILYFLGLFFLLLASVVTLAYVVFFRTVVAAPASVPAPAGDIIFEEPNPPPHEKTPDHPLRNHRDLPRIAIIIDDMGYHQKIGNELLELPLPLSFSFLPHAPFTRELEEKTYQLGRDVLLHLPMEPCNHQWNPGPGALYLKDDRLTHERILAADLQLVPHAVGVNNHMGSCYTENGPAMTELADMLVVRHLFFIDSFTTARSMGLTAARQRGIPASRRQVFLDNIQKSEAICGQLKKLVHLASKQGQAIGIGHPYPETLAAFRGCGPEILDGTQLVGVSRLVK